jgi:hypothetical protein
MIAQHGQTPAVRREGSVAIHAHDAFSEAINAAAATVESSPEPTGNGNAIHRRTGKEMT